MVVMQIHMLLDQSFWWFDTV